MKKDWIACNTCGADDYQILANASDWPIGKCVQCGQIYVNPVPVFEHASKSSQISSRHMCREITPSILRYDEIQLKQHLADIRRLTAHGWSEVKFLDVGCGSGASVKAATQLGWEATGLDIDEQLISTGQSQLGIDLRCTTLLDAQLPANHFHFVRLRDVIEHLPNPYETLVEIKRILVPGGVLLLATPNQVGLPTQILRWLGMRPNKLASDSPPHNLHSFSPDTITRILVRTGFNIMEVKTTTPVDPNYATSNNMRSSRNLAFVLILNGARLIGQGSILVAWAENERIDALESLHASVGRKS